MVVEHAPPSRYLWCFGDDDVIAPGGLRAIAALLRDERPAWLFLPHVFVDANGEEEQRSPAPSAIERWATGAELYQRYHHWLTFLTASIVGRQAFQDAVAAIDTDNAYIPLLWFFRAGREGPCAVAPRTSSTARARSPGPIARMTSRRCTSPRLWDDGLRAGLSEEEFGATLDGLYGQGFGFVHWRRQPLERLLEVVARFPQSRGLREFLWGLAIEQQRPDALPVLHEAARATGDDARARALIQEGEERYANGNGERRHGMLRGRYPDRAHRRQRVERSRRRAASAGAAGRGHLSRHRNLRRLPTTATRGSTARRSALHGAMRRGRADASHVLDRDPANEPRGRAAGSGLAHRRSGPRVVEAGTHRGRWPRWPPVEARACPAASRTARGRSAGPITSHV